MASIVPPDVDGTGDTDHTVDGIISQTQSIQLASNNGDGANETAELDGSVSIDAITVNTTAPSYDFKGFSSTNQVEPCEDEDGLTSPSSPSGLDEETTNLIVENLIQTGNFTRDVCLQAVGIAGTDLSLCFDICTSLQSTVLQFTQTSTEDGTGYADHTVDGLIS